MYVPSFVYFFACCCLRYLFDVSCAFSEAAHTRQKSDTDERSRLLTQLEQAHDRISSWQQYDALLLSCSSHAAFLESEALMFVSLRSS